MSAESSANPLFSIIVVHYQGVVPHLVFCRAIDSLNAQTFKDFEILAYHDGPLLEPGLKMPAPIICTPRREGDWGHSLRDRGIREAHGKYLLHLNADNVLYPFALAELAKEIARPPRLFDDRGEALDTSDIIIFPVVMFGLIKFREVTRNLKNRQDFYLILTGNPPTFLNIDCMQFVMKRELWLKEGGWYDKREAGDGYMYEAFAKKYGYRTVGPVLGEHYEQAWMTMLLTFTSQWARYPLLCRAETSDAFVFHQIFFQREYRLLDDVPDGGLIIDCGANVGYSSAYFSTRLPRSQVIAVEPDPENFEMLKQNLAPYGPAAKLLHAAVWSHPAKLAFVESPYRGGGAWTVQVRECGADEQGSIDAVDIGTLLQEAGHERIRILKMDVEGAEAVIFAKNFEPWIDKVDNIAIELHGDSVFGDASLVFGKAIADRGFALQCCGELIICKRQL